MACLELSEHSSHPINVCAAMA